MTKQTQNNVTQSNTVGQSLTEYIILVGLVAIGSMFLVSKFGESIKTATGNIINVLSGQNASVHRDVEAVGNEYMGRTDLWQSIRKRPTSKGRR